MNPGPGSKFNILAFDTALPHISAAVMSDVILAKHEEAMARGQAEKLFPVLNEVMAQAGIAFADLNAIAVGIGPGNFTGIRISVAAARGLALGLGIPAIGISTFEVMRPPEDGMQEANELVSIQAPRDQAYVQHFRHGKPLGAPHLIDPFDPPEALRLPVNMIVTGYMATQIASRFNAKAAPASLTDFGTRIARRADWRLNFEKEHPTRPAPLYVRPADAAPSKDHAPKILT